LNQSDTNVKTIPLSPLEYITTRIYNITLFRADNYTCAITQLFIGKLTQCL